MRWLYSACALGIASFSFSSQIFANQIIENTENIEPISQVVSTQPPKRTFTSIPKINITERYFHESVIPIEATSPYLESKSEVLKYVLQRTPFKNAAAAFDSGIGPKLKGTHDGNALEARIRAKKIDEVGLHLEVQNIILGSSSTELAITNERATASIKYDMKKGTRIGEAGVYVDHKFDKLRGKTDTRGYIGISLRY